MPSHGQSDAYHHIPLGTHIKEENKPLVINTSGYYCDIKSNMET